MYHYLNEGYPASMAEHKNFLCYCCFRPASLEKFAHIHHVIAPDTPTQGRSRCPLTYQVILCLVRRPYRLVRLPV
ncbi:SORF3 protein [Gallid alphaherpesvirus 3]|uniref:SORF3 protein n=2 Tax=Gallid alphaherpesvirus 3 TaxID=35250 RepID=Q782N1_9ALPH|nr:SORF3 protein [Gallid alphaherpesvirus 3]AEI00290.1 SORF3 protein [Gallid alphaherpesvirus 3]QEY02323.1 SORF3 protein [Gallid alphaherpesvirus 3]BAA32005.1 unnamed protein product [Marek's disease virus serotype 2 MDV2]BAB16584.1 SORF3 protein [Gallid alphaherpesvirus 3]